MTRDTYFFTVSPTAIFLGIGLISLNLTKMLGTMAAVVFLGCCLALICMKPKRILSDARTAIWLWLLVLWCIVSFLWSGAPSLMLRYGIQLGLTFMLAISAAMRISMTSLLKVLLVTGLITGILCLGLNRTNAAGAWAGIFGSKNALAQFATINVLIGFALLLDAKASGVWRIVAVIVLGLGALLLVNADSVGALVATGTACVMMLIIAILHFSRPLLRMLLMSLAGLILLAAVFAIASNFEAFSLTILDLTGKDVTLTGRTVLWGIAFDEIAKYPLWGQGYKGYWVPGNPMAEELWLEFGIASKEGFHFHNTLISNAVEIGLIGVALQSGLFYFAFFVIVRASVLYPSAETLFLAGFMVRQFALMQSEVVFFSHFHVVSLLTVMTIVYAIRIFRTDDLSIEADSFSAPLDLGQFTTDRKVA